MATDHRELVERMLQAFADKDLAATVDCFADDALLYDPHYPEPAMQGTKAIAEGLGFAFGMMKQPGFAIRHFWADGRSGALEVDTHHQFQDGSEAQFPQMFAFEVADGKLSRFQAYVPYPPPANGQ